MTGGTDPWILGLSASHNGAACLLRGREVVVAVQEERLTRRKRARLLGASPSLAVPYCLSAAGITPAELSAIAISCQRGIRSAHEDVTLNEVLHPTRYGTKVFHVPHHRAHALSAYGLSGRPHALALVVDGMGSPSSDFTDDERRVISEAGEPSSETASAYVCDRGTLRCVWKTTAPSQTWITSAPRGVIPGFFSLGGMFSALAELAFRNIMEAGKVMGLAPYGEPEFPPDLFVEVRGDELFFPNLLASRLPPLEPWPKNHQVHANLAASAQVALEQTIIAIVRRLLSRFPSATLCYSGGVALNSVANEQIMQALPGCSVYVPAAAEDSGCALGAAFHALWSIAGFSENRPQRRDSMGRRYSAAEVREAIDTVPGIEARVTEDVLETAVHLLCQGKIGIWFEGGSELGPRALGQRSILMDARVPDGKAVLNSRVKKREMFRPFAPVILAECFDDWFEGSYGDGALSSLMLRVAPFRADRRALVPSVVHIDGTGRVQTVERSEHPRLHALIKAFAERTGVPLLLNTSLNAMGEPIVETPVDALWCMVVNGIDFAVIENDLVQRDTATADVLGFWYKTLVKFVTYTADLSPEAAPPAGPRETAICHPRSPWGVHPVSLDETQRKVVECARGWIRGADVVAALGPALAEGDVRRALVALVRCRVLTVRAGERPARVKCSFARP